MRGGDGSLPTRERGLKSYYLYSIRHIRKVAPYAGAWIEMQLTGTLITPFEVAPYAGAWIEMVKR